MSGVALNWAMSADPEATQTLAAWSTNIRNAKPAFDEMADYIAASQKEWFKTKGNGTWAPLSPRYAAWKRKRFPKRGILHGPDRPGHRGLQLRDELTKRPFGVERLTARALTLGTDQAYVDALANGTGETLGSSSLFTRAVASSDSADSTFFVDVNPFEQYYLPEVSDADAREALEQLGAVGISSSNEGEGEGTFTLRLVADEE